MGYACALEARAGLVGVSECRGEGVCRHVPVACAAGEGRSHRGRNPLFDLLEAPGHPHSGLPPPHRGWAVCTACTSISLPAEGRLREGENKV